MDALVVGASNIVGRPLALELLLAGATVNIAHRFTRNLERHVRAAELLCVAVGKPDLIDPSWVAPGSIVIDIGISRKPEGGLRGDLDFDAVAERAAWLTPVPGGVGPMTVATLMQNTAEAAGLVVRRAMIRGFIVLLVLLNAGCAALVDRAAERFANDLETAIREYNEPDVIGDGLPSFLLFARSAYQRQSGRSGPAPDQCAIDCHLCRAVQCRARQVSAPEPARAGPCPYRSLSLIGSSV